MHTNAECGRKRAVQNGNAAWRAGEQNGLGQRAMQRHFKSVAHVELQAGPMVAPPANPKKLVTRVVAAKAIEMPKTIWIILRKPPETSPNASARPLTAIASTAMICAVGPVMDCIIVVSGASQGMPEPAANACVTIRFKSGTASQRNVRFKRMPADLR